MKKKKIMFDSEENERSSGSHLHMNKSQKIDELVSDDFADSRTRKTDTTFVNKQKHELKCFFFCQNGGISFVGLSDIWWWDDDDEVWVCQVV